MAANAPPPLYSARRTQQHAPPPPCSKDFMGEKGRALRRRDGERGGVRGAVEDEEVAGCRYGGEGSHGGGAGGVAEYGGAMATREMWWSHGKR